MPSGSLVRCFNYYAYVCLFYLEKKKRIDLFVFRRIMILNIYYGRHDELLERAVVIGGVFIVNKFNRSARQRTSEAKERDMVIGSHEKNLIDDHVDGKTYGRSLL